MARTTEVIFEYRFYRQDRRQYAGRLYRLHDNKKVVRIYDYVDVNVPMLTRMYNKRLKGYNAIGYSVRDVIEVPPDSPSRE